jgi:hypothetical protein
MNAPFAENDSPAIIGSNPPKNAPLVWIGQLLSDALDFDLAFAVDPDFNSSSTPDRALKQKAETGDLC